MYVLTDATTTRDGRSQLVLPVTSISFTNIDINLVPNVIWTGLNNTLITPGC